ncbi:MAG TPA: YheU family protein [Candidatus Binatia bacterium]|jgi:uncharacterized protein YheU (UPF0270 family)|nr:YheU family protein [Candidatus Binatia bacterium]
MDQDDDAPPPIDVPPEALPAATLRALLEEFVTRDGTDYGTHERSLDDKVRDVLRQIARGEAKIVFDPASQTANVVPGRR